MKFSKVLPIFFLTVGLATPALADTTINYPRLGNRLIDATPWEWNGHNYSENVAKTKAANLVCKSLGYNYALSYAVVKGQAKGKARFHENGSIEYCDFCQWYFSKVTCR
ncbi:MAG: hypothetical protein QNJ54_23700 [Prochloraceae cyanobacterium]|nr:hypothetical protein [Prochloraceae cyanobacterium]